MKAVAEKLVKVGLAIGYPNKNADDYDDRLRLVMTESGVAKQKKDLHNFDTKAVKQDRLLRQQQRDGRWKTLKTDDDTTTIEMTLVNDNGTWLVDTAG